MAISNARVEASGPMGHGTRIICNDGTELKGIRSISINPITPGDLITMTCELIGAALNINGAVKFCVSHPLTGKPEVVKRIEFDSAPTFEA